MLKYVGQGVSLPEVPARNLTDEEVERFGEKFLKETGLYERPRKQRTRDESKNHSMGTGTVSPL